ncbi:MAG: HesA/MoeB/ThiF family protein [Flavobacteriaceae bacterium]|nr:HesA/MoeB/ThiF family protein [Flavobacteriaceae bacterium]
MNRYSRHIILSDIGQQGQDKLSKAKVLVVGAGGLGCPVLQYLTAAGIGNLGIIDFDIVEESNLQRQVLFGTSSLGMNKAIAAKKRLEDLNPTISIDAISEKLTTENALQLFKQYDIVVDGSDNFATRYLVNDAAILCNKPFVYGAIYKFEGQVSVFNYNKGPGYRCLFPNPPKEGSVANCSEVGVLSVLPGIIGTMMANEVIKIILGFEHVLSGKLLCYNSKTADISTLKVNRNQSEFDKVLGKEKLLGIYENESCEVLVKDISEEELATINNIQFIDVREPHEQPKLEIKNCMEIPLGHLESNLQLLDSDKTKVVFCQSGIRSKKAVELLMKQGFNDTFNFKGGVFPLVEALKQNIYER